MSSSESGGHERNPKDQTVRSFVSKWSVKTPEAIAFAAPERVALTYHRLGEHVTSVTSYLNSIGLGRNDRVAIVLPNGPDLATMFLAATSGAVCAPLNPEYREKEFEFFLSDLGAKALIVQAGMDSPALEVAEKKGLSIIRLQPLPEAGVFSLNTDSKAAPAKETCAEPGDPALVLHTSGTTSRPKMVSLTHNNICSSASSIRESLRLTQNDCCLNVMPLFHIHGLIGATLSSMSAGARVVCTPGFYASQFFEWIRLFEPTWYTAVPTMHQAVLARASLEENRQIIKNSKLRLIRSSSSALPPQVMTALETAFSVPVIEAYGMTEASHQIASNPLPPLKRKTGSVGMAAGPEIAIMDEKGWILPRSEIGEIVLRGPSIIKAYVNNPNANISAFTDGWFRTGDQGYLDEDNYLVIKDRIKEIINRGGEKISPREVDEVILTHPHVAQVVTFAIPDQRLGEDVGAAVVPRQGSDLSEWEIQKYVASRLAEFKVPSRVIVLDDIPKGPTGKIQRIGLAKRLGLDAILGDKTDSRGQYQAPKTPLEESMTEIWARTLRLKRVGIDDNFFLLGGDSIQAGQILMQICKMMSLERIPLVIFLHAPTIREMARILENKDLDLRPASLVAIQKSGKRPAFYCVHDGEGEILFMTSLARHLGTEQPFYGLRAQGLEGGVSPYARVDEMASHYLKEIQAVQPTGPYIIGGAGNGGIVAWEMAQRLKALSQEVQMLVLLDTVFPRIANGRLNPYAVTVEHNMRQLALHAKNGDIHSIIVGACNSIQSIFVKIFHVRRVQKTSGTQGQVSILIQRAVNSYIPKIYDGRIVLFVSKRRQGFSQDPNVRIRPWEKYASNRFDAHVVPGLHLEILKEPNVPFLAEKLRKYLDDAPSEKT